MADMLMAPGLDAADSYEAMMKFAFLKYQEKCRLLEAAQREIETLRADLRRLQSGADIFIEIEGRRFVLSLAGASLIDPSVRDEVSQKLAAVHPGDGWLNSTPKPHVTEALAGLDVFSKDDEH
jgi:hypothetical protein